MSKVFLYVLTFILLALPVSFAFDDAINLVTIENVDQRYYITYDFDLSEKFELEDRFILTATKENELDQICNKSILDEDESLYLKKITCELSPEEEGKYTLEGQIQREGESVYSFSNNIFHYQQVSAYYDFTLKENSTTITLNLDVDEEYGAARIYSSIPNSVIAELNEENRDDLITSQLPFEIVENNPLIAWNVEQVPDEIEYEIHRGIEQEQTQDFTMQIEQSQAFSIMRWIVGAGIIGIILLVLIPAFRKK